MHNGDLVFKNGDFILTDKDIDQSLHLILSTGKGECFYNPDFGINRENILGKVTDSEIRNEIISGIAQEERVEIIDSVEIKREKRSAKASFKGRIRDEGNYEGEVLIGARSPRI